MSSSLEHFESTLGAAGLKISASNILDLADPMYGKVPEEIKAAAWLAAEQHGWTKNGLKMIIRDLMNKRYDEDMANLIISNLEEAAKNHPNIMNCP